MDSRGLCAAVLSSSLLLSVLAWGQPKRKVPPSPPDLRALIECEKTMRDWMALAQTYKDVAARTAWGWRDAKLGTGMLTSYTLGKPIQVFGQSTSQIAFSGTSVVAVLKDKKLESVVKALHLEPAYDGVNSKIFARVVHGDETDAGNENSHIKISLTAASSVDYPGVVLAGCSYEANAE